MSNPRQSTRVPPASSMQQDRHGDLMQRLARALREDGTDPDQPSIDSLAPYDHLHGRGIEATEQLARLFDVDPAHHLLDIGSGIGGPARVIARRFGCQVTGIDLSDEFCRAAEHLTQALGLENQVRFLVGNALAMPFTQARFDGAYSMHVSMNIDDKPRLYGEIARVLKPNGWLALSELTSASDTSPDYPMPWAALASDSFLATPTQTRRALEVAGFEIEHWRETMTEHLAFAARSLEIVQHGGRAPQRAVPLVHHEYGERAVRHANAAIADGRIMPIEILCRLARRDETVAG